MKDKKKLKKILIISLICVFVASLVVIILLLCLHKKPEIDSNLKTMSFEKKVEALPEADTEFLYVINDFNDSVVPVPLTHSYNEQAVNKSEIVIIFSHQTADDLETGTEAYNSSCYEQAYKVNSDMIFGSVPYIALNGTCNDYGEMEKDTEFATDYSLHVNSMLLNEIIEETGEERTININDIYSFKSNVDIYFNDYMILEDSTGIEYDSFAFKLKTDTITETSYIYLQTKSNLTLEEKQMVNINRINGNEHYIWLVNNQNEEMKSIYLDKEGNFSYFYFKERTNDGEASFVNSGKHYDIDLDSPVTTDLALSKLIFIESADYERLKYDTKLKYENITSGINGKLNDYITFNDSLQDLMYGRYFYNNSIKKNERFNESLHNDYGIVTIPSIYNLLECAKNNPQYFLQTNNNKENALLKLEQAKKYLDYTLFKTKNFVTPEMIRYSNGAIINKDVFDIRDSVSNTKMVVDSIEGGNIAQKYSSKYYQYSFGWKKNWLGNSVSVDKGLLVSQHHADFYNVQNVAENTRKIIRINYALPQFEVKTKYLDSEGNWKEEFNNVEYGKEISLNIPKNPPYATFKSFENATKQADGTYKATIISDVTFTAQYDYELFNVEFYVNGILYKTLNNVTYYDRTILSTHCAEMGFKGWFLNEGGTLLKQSNFRVDKDMKLYAKISKLSIGDWWENLGGLELAGIPLGKIIQSLLNFIGIVAGISLVGLIIWWIYKASIKKQQK